MILPQLVSLYDRLFQDPKYSSELPEYGESVQKISFEIVLDADGMLVEIQDARHEEKKAKGKGKLEARNLIVLGGAHASGSSEKKPSPRFLWDNSAYLLGYYTQMAKKTEKDKQIAREVLFPHFRDYHLNLREKYAIQDKGFQAVCKFLENWRPDQISDEVCQKLEQVAENNGVFRLVGERNYVYQSQEVLSAWKKDEEAKDKCTKKQYGMCLVTGQANVRLARLVEPCIKNLPNSGVGGAKLTSFKEPATESYGREQAYNAPISEFVSFKACNALNFLMEHDQYHVRLASTTVVFWTERPIEKEDLLTAYFGSASASNEAMDSEQVEKVNAFWRRVRKGVDAVADEFSSHDLTTPFYMLGIEANSKRLVIRFWQETSVGEFAHRVQRHLQNLEIDKIEKRFPNKKELLSFRDLLIETTPRSLNDKKRLDAIPPLLASALLRSVLEGTPYPKQLFQLMLNQAKRRDKGELGSVVSYAQASFFKAYLIRNCQKGELTVSLNPENKNPAYLLGRLFATLEKTQGDALGDVNAGVADKFYSSASSTPSLVFPLMLNLYRKWIKKLEAENKGLVVSREKLVREIVNALDPDQDQAFPATLSLEDRGFFALGYYQQMCFFFKKKSEVASPAETNSPTL